MDRVDSLILRRCLSARQSLLLSFISLLILGSNTLAAQAGAGSSNLKNANIAYFEDIAGRAGLTATTIFGGVDTKKYILETTGTGLAIFDYDNDGWPDIFLVNGIMLEASSKEEAPTNHLYRNNHDGTFADVTESRPGFDGMGTGRMRR
jgi:hypothetical protein